MWLLARKSVELWNVKGTSEVCIIDLISNFLSAHHHFDNLLWRLEYFLKNPSEKWLFEKCSKSINYKRKNISRKPSSKWNHWRTFECFPEFCFYAFYWVAGIMYYILPFYIKNNTSIYLCYENLWNHHIWLCCTVPSCGFVSWLYPTLLLEV